MITGYQNEKGGKVLRQSFCAYFDILGFGNKIKSNDIPYFNNYLNVLERELKYIKKEINIYEDFNLKIFTDNFVLGHPWYDIYGESELGNVFDVLSHFQFHFAISDIFIRGAVSMSDLYMDSNIVIGPALIEAYDLEQKRSTYPRIILSKDVNTVVKKHIGYYRHATDSPQSRQYLKDRDGEYFVNYLYYVQKVNKYDKERLKRLIGKHRDVVTKNLKEHKENFKLLNLYQWVGNYHNYFCENFMHGVRATTLERLKIKNELLDQPIERII